MIEFPVDTRKHELRLAAAGMLAVAAAWRVLPVHPPFKCPLLTITGIPCPFCGMTRSVVAFMHGDIVGSLRFNPAGILVVALAIFLILRPRIPSIRVPLWTIYVALGGLWAY